MPGFDPEATAPVRRGRAHAETTDPRRADADPADVVPGPASKSPSEVDATAGDPVPAPESATGSRAARGGRRSVHEPAPERAALLPDITTDERDIGWGDLPEPGDDDRYLREVPPHHGN